MVGKVGQSATEQRFHHDHWNVALVEFGIQIVGIVVAPRSMTVIHIIQLYLHKIPFKLIVP